MIHEFGPFRYDAEQRLLFRGADLVPLVPKALDTLHVLLEHRGRILDKAELMKLIWPDTTVEDVGLARNISILRKALEDDSETYIETIPRRGYRFTAAAPPETPAPPARRPRWPIALVATLALAALVYWQFYAPSRHLPSATASLAIAPFPLDGFNDVLAAELSKVPHLHVVSPSTVRRYQTVRVSMPMMARILGVEVLVEGSIQPVGDRLRYSIRLVDVHSGKLIWADTYEESAAAQLAVAQKAAAEIHQRLH